MKLRKAELATCRMKAGDGINVYLRIVLMVAVLFVSNLAVAGSATANKAKPIKKDAHRVWLSSACTKLNLGVWDKLAKGPYHAKYVVKSADGRVFVAERNGNDNSDAAAVIFPDDFQEEKLKLKAWINCRYGASYTWAIYADNALVDSGRITFSRKNRK